MDLSTIKDRLEAARENGQEIVVVIGLGFVGTAVSANLARTRINSIGERCIIRRFKDD